MNHLLDRRKKESLVERQLGEFASFLRPTCSFINIPPERGQGEMVRTPRSSRFIKASQRLSCRGRIEDNEDESDGACERICAITRKGIVVSTEASAREKSLCRVRREDELTVTHCKHQEQGRPSNVEHQRVKTKREASMVKLLGGQQFAPVARAFPLAPPRRYTLPLLPFTPLPLLPSLLHSYIPTPSRSLSAQRVILLTERNQR